MMLPISIGIVNSRIFFQGEPVVISTGSYNFLNKFIISPLPAYYHYPSIALLNASW